MEKLVMPFFNSTYKGKRVFITGHTGFKGSWLACWLKELGAEVHGYSLAPKKENDHINVLAHSFSETIDDLSNREGLEKAMKQFNPDVIFHLAAQPLVRYSYANPIETYETNVIGTLNVLEAARKTSNVKAIINITTDKVYENTESPDGYNESQKLGGHDPYSASKACSEILTSSYERSFFNLEDFNKNHTTLIGRARGGNVIGGGDWSDDRLVPDIFRALNKNIPIEIRSPKSVRPWQHVLDCISGYLLLGQQLLEGDATFSGPWNFGPIEPAKITVESILNMAKAQLKGLTVHFGTADLHETTLLQLDCQKAQDELNWKPILSTEESFEWTFSWYQTFIAKKEVITLEQLNNYCNLATEKGAIWTK